MISHKLFNRTIDEKGYHIDAQHIPVDETAEQ